ncbi:MAG: DUF2169 domain-containing protein [Sandaracinaceae bacterium]|nr:DUF2169 domain-containing protein [Sandaracinaceae bacterium]
MRVYKDTPFELSMMPWELEPPRTTLMVVIKATFDLGQDGLCTIAAEQVPCLGEVPWEDGEPPSLRTESDYAVLKPRGEWYLVGHAHAPGGRPATVVAVRARVGKLQKQLAVWGDRTWQMGLLGAKPSSPAPFTSMPLRWERSFGGPKIADNPAGCGTTSVQTKQGSHEPVPNIEDPTRPFLSRDDRHPPAGMFPIPVTWKARTARAGTYDAAWKASRWPYFPRDFDFTFFNCAPPDQWLPDEFWRGDEEIELSGLHPERTRIRARLPGLVAKAFVEWRTPRPEGARPLELLSRRELQALGTPRLQEIPLKLDTIAIDGDTLRVMCSWRGLIEVQDSRLSNVQRLFVVHEPMGSQGPREHYEQWLMRKLLEEADEFGFTSEDPALDEALPAPIEPPQPTQLGTAISVFRSDLLAFLETLAPLNTEANPSIEEVRAKYAELGADPDAILPEPEVPVVLPEIDEPRSLVRLGVLTRRMHGRHFHGVDLSDGPFDNLDLSGVDFTGSVLTGASFAGANLSGAVFDGANLDRANLMGANARGASFRETSLNEVLATEACFDEAVLDDAQGSRAIFEKARFRKASLVATELSECDLSATDFREARLDSVDLVRSILDGADLTGASLADATLEGIHAHDTIFERSKMPDLRGSDGADFTRARLVLVEAPRAQLQGAILEGANLSGSNLGEADLSDARASKANFLRCNMRAAKLDRCDLREAVLLQCDLFEASLEEAELGRADARGAHLFSANLRRAQLSGALLEGAILDRTLLGRS